MSTAIRSLLSRPGVGLTANVVQQSSLRISHLAVDNPALILLVHGRKTLSAGGRKWNASPGNAIIVAAGQRLDVRNQLSAGGLFEARWVVWDAKLFAQAGPLPARQRVLTDVAILKQVPAALLSAVENAIEAIGNPSAIPAPVAAHRMIELLLWLGEHGIKLTGGRAVSAASRLRGLISGTPATPWTASMAADRIATSEATLRRRLVSEGTSFSAVLTDARMSLAMTLLQSTDRPIAAIASDVGYESASRFAVRFRSRYGFAPSAVRGHNR